MEKSKPYWSKVVEDNILTLENELELITFLIELILYLMVDISEMLDKDD